MKKLLIETYGCQMNVADSEVVASVMRMAGYEPCEDIDQADAVFLNTCSVRDNAEQKIIHRLQALHALRKKGRRLILGVLGCMAERVKDDLLEKHHADIVADLMPISLCPTSLRKPRWDKKPSTLISRSRRLMATSCPNASADRRFLVL